MERTSDEQIAIASMLLTLMDEHPQPWRIDIKFSPEIYDGNGHTFLTPPTTESAKFIVSLAAEFDKQLKSLDSKNQSIPSDEPDWPHSHPEWLD